MQRLNSMENQKKTYLKPVIRVEEWDFNEAVCQTQAYNCSDAYKCISISGAKERDLVDTYPDYNGGGTDWRPVSTRN